MPATTETTPHASAFNLEKNLEPTTAIDVPPMTLTTPSSPECLPPQPSIRLLFSLVPRPDFYLITLPAVVDSAPVSPVSSSPKLAWWSAHIRDICVPQSPDNAGSAMLG
ncbi:hypothetical protein FOMPIDRAFT_1056317 [Fomitopsis schrenkii]|uniref:Uncharacterized protein n=1 Tax=Fomitopsis schrenkii TaxID=2126942 RepID=S8ETK5_FOMSC|nr:hypothetical protein FOMPIDRAFT_1056317 [Fomitopsis schrenkii]